MNGITNVIAALILGGAVIWGVSTFQSKKEAEPMSAAEVEAFKQRAMAEVKAQMEQSCSAEIAAIREACSSERLGAIDLGTPEDPYPQTTSEDPVDGVEIASEEAYASGVSSGETYSADPQTAVLAANYGGDETQTNSKVDKPDSNRYFTEDRRLETSSPTAGLVDKPDSGKYFTETKTIDGSSPIAGLIDKPDSGQFWTEDKPMNPCLREDGTVYTGPGTAQDPFAEGDPCLVTEKFAEQEITDPCYVDPQTGLRPGYDPSLYPDGDPCITEWREETPPEDVPPTVIHTTELPPYIPPLPPRETDVPEAPIQVASNTPPTWVTPYADYTLPWITSPYPGPMPTVRGGSDYRPQQCDHHNCQ